MIGTDAARLRQDAEAESLAADALERAAREHYQRPALAGRLNGIAARHRETANRAHDQLQAIEAKGEQ